MAAYIPIGMLLEEKTIFYGNDVNDVWNMGFYGEKIENQLILLPFETLYLVERGKIKVCSKEGKFLSFNELLHYFLKYDPDVWTKYVIYSDLRQRGYIVKGGFDNISFRVYEKGAIVGKDVAKMIVYGVVEGKPISLHEIKEMVKSARSIKKDLILAILNSQGEISYYSVNEVSF
ncbi:MAG: tRNA-intron lyase [Candidatus Methanomethylicia archaeon]